MEAWGQNLKWYSRSQKKKKKKQYIKKFGIIIFNPSPQYTHKGLPHPNWKQKKKKKKNGVKAVIINMQYCANRSSIGILKFWAKAWSAA